MGLIIEISGQYELGRLPTVNLHDQVCERELKTPLSAVLVSSRTPFRPICRRIENVRASEKSQKYLELANQVKSISLL